MNSAVMVDYAGRQLGNYRLIRLLGQGGFADVYLGEHIYLKTPAAIKILQLHLTNEALDKFLAEARTIARLSHPHIVRVLEFGIEQNTPFLVMNFAPYGSLRQRHPLGSMLPAGKILPYVRQLSAALQYAHERKIIHRDVKPENMLLGDEFVLMLSDFGLATTVRGQSMVHHTRSAAGTTTYMAPEQFDGVPSPASDQYALGVVVYEWFCGTPPFRGSDMGVAVQHMQTPPPPLREWVPSLAPAIEQVVLRALAKSPQARFTDIQEFAQALEAACQGNMQTAAPSSSLILHAAPPVAQPQNSPDAQPQTPPAAPLTPIVPPAEEPQTPPSPPIAPLPLKGPLFLNVPEAQRQDFVAATVADREPQQLPFDASRATLTPPPAAPQRQTQAEPVINIPLPGRAPISISRRRALFGLACGGLAVGLGALAIESVLALSQNARHPTNTAPPQKRATPTPNVQATAQALINVASSRPILLARGAGLLDLYVRAVDGSLWRRHYDGTWHAWESLGGKLAGDPAIASWGGERLDMLVRAADNTLQHRYYDGQTWHDWTVINQSVTSDPALVSWGPGRLDAFVRGPDNALWHNYYDGQTWHTWDSRGGTITSSPAATSWAPNRLDVFARGTDNALWTQSWVTLLWTPWVPLGGSYVGDPTVTTWGPNSLFVFVRGPNGDLQYLGFNGAWQPWQTLGGQLGGSPSAVSWGPNRIDVVARDASNRLQHIWFDGIWHTWTPLQ